MTARLSWLIFSLVGLAAALPQRSVAHGSEYVYARLILGPQPRLEVSLEYTENPIVPSREGARAALANDLILRSGGQAWRLAELLPQPLWGEATAFPQSAPVPVPGPGEGPHRLVTAVIDLTGRLPGALQLSVAAGSEQAVIYWIEELGAENGPPKWKVLLAGDTSPAVGLGSAVSTGGKRLAG